MLKRAKAEAQDDAASQGGTVQQAKELSQAVLDSSRDIWLAGLGAFSRAQAEGMKVFDTLVRQGREVETKTRRVAADTANVAREVATEKAKEMQKAAGGTWDKLEQVFENRVARALAKLGVYTQDDVRKLSERVDALSDAVNRLIASQSGGKKVASPASRGTSKRARKIASAPGASNAAGARKTGKTPGKRGRKSTRKAASSAT
ncbi:MAG TPA: phasin family protein [Rhodanobacteraceae bacterium]